MLRFLSTVALAVLAFPAAALTTYNDRDLFNQAVAQLTGPLSVVSDAFDTDIAAATKITFASGIKSTLSAPSQFATDNSVSAGFFTGGTGGSFSASSITWDFGRSVRAFGADLFDFGSNGVTLSVDDGSGLRTFSRNNGIGDQRFFGFIGQGTFQTIVFGTGPSGGRDAFDVDNVTFAAPIEVIPLPATLPLLAAGVAAFAAFRRRRAA